ncbi:protein CNPPD1 [Calliopsis andreniformis]|uniref:protein CNPPD1 n=1 Tax=Calliopsis andreniformis TaxID=337506 RepID=UPI003FCC882A
MTNISKRKKASPKLKTMGNRDEFLNRITKSLYYSILPMTDCLSLPVTELAAELFTEVKSGRTLERLDVEEASRISRNACVSPCSLVLALLYLERLKDCNPEYLQRVAPSELFLVTLMVASKFLNDEGEEDEVFNTEWAQSGDLSISHMNQLEKDFLKAIDWTVFVCNRDFWERLQRLEKDIAYKEAQKRGWFSYTELSCLMNSVQLITLAHAVVNISSICLATYTAGIVTLLGSALVGSYLPGTVLSPRQTATDSTNVSRVDINPLVDITQENILTTGFIPTSLSCNQSQEYRESTELNKTEDEHWKWWLNSVMTWLPEYSGLESKETLHTMNEENDHTLMTTKFVLDTSKLMQDTDEFMIMLNWKQLLSIDLKFLLYDWRYYINYVTKITLGHQY